MVDVKFCGLTREADAEAAGALSAVFVGVVFAGGPRAVTPTVAARVLDAAGAGPRRVGVFGASEVGEIARVADRARLDIVQLHGDPSEREVDSVRKHTGCTLWSVVRIDPTLAHAPEELTALSAASDAIVLDARVSGALGGTGVQLPWGQLYAVLAACGGGARVVLAGGLTPDNVADAVRLVRPAVVDVSSGVESAPGQKDHGRMRAFAHAARLAAAS